MPILTEPILTGNRLALSRALTAAENNTPEGRAILSELYPRGGHAHLIGITGSPGTGKSSLVNEIVLQYRRLNSEKRVAIIAVDPTSPFSGGAVLGDRVRMRDLSGDEGIFIRSMASRGALGGLARQTAALAQLFDCAGYDLVLIETVGAGQNEVDIVRLAHTTIVVEAPGLGDDIQAIKAGILEIADILVVNKADHPGVEATERALKTMLELANGNARYKGHHIGELSELAVGHPASGGWTPPVLRTIATEKTGIQELLDQIEAHRQWLVSTGEWERRERARVETEIHDELHAELLRRWEQDGSKGTYQAVLQKVLRREMSPQEGVFQILK
jgi:LAO/AO transport system kinase